MNNEIKGPDGLSVKKITDFVAYEDRELLRDSVYTLSAFLFLFLTQDRNTNPNFDGVEQMQVHMPTLLRNAMTVIQGHYPEICFAWLRSCDENYSSDNELAKYVGTSVNLVNDENNAPPGVEVDVEIESERATVTLSSIIRTDAGVDANSYNNGSAIYYSVYENGEMASAWQLYRAPIVIETANDTEYTVKAFAVRFEEKGAEIEITNEQLRPQKYESDLGQNGVGDENSSNVDKKALMIIVASVALILIAIVVVVLAVKRRSAKKR